MRLKQCTHFIMNFIRMQITLPMLLKLFTYTHGHYEQLTCNSISISI